MESRKRTTTETTTGSSPSKSLKSERHGSSGIPVEIIANYFKVEKLPAFSLNQYRIDFIPDLDVTNTRKKIIADNSSKFGRYLFDGASMYLTQDLSDFTFETTHDGRPIKVIIRKTGSVDSADPTAFQLYNLIFRDAMAGLKLQNVRRDYFDPHAKIPVPLGKLELWPGYLTSIRAHEEDVLMNAEILHKVMRNQTILDIARALMLQDSRNWQENLKREVIGTTVLTDYTNKTYMIDDVDFSMTPNSTFTQANGQKVSFKDYYKKQYNIDIKDPRQFLLVSNAKERDRRAGKPESIHLIPELSRATGMTDEMRNNFKLMQEMSAYMRLNPEKRVKALEKFNKRIQSTPESVKVLQEWNMKLDENLVRISGRELTSETIVFGNDFTTPANPKGEWILGRGVHLHQPVTIKRWIVMYPKLMATETKEFLSTLEKKFAEIGCKMNDPLLLQLDGDSQELYVSKIQEIAPKNPKMLFVVLPTNRLDRYSAIKKLCLVSLGIPTQIVIKKSISHKNVGSIASKVAIQMNAKLGGLPWMIKLPVKGLMTVGFDVSHHPRDKSRSIGALVATMDLKKTGAFYSITSSYRDGNEMNVKLAIHMKKALEIYKETCDCLPEKILFYRDGVGDGQVLYVMQQEVEPLVRKLKEIYGEQQPSLAYIVVNKRTNTRLFKKNGASIVNPKPGTVIDRGITLPGRNDFFLVSQHVGQGTVAPTSYNILYNSSGLSKDKLEILTYKMTHLYFNWSGTTRIPAVSQYAKKLAFLTSQSLGEPVNENLLKTLYFL